MTSEYRTRIEDFKLALDSVDKLCNTYAWKGKDTWKEQSAVYHLRHAMGHLKDLLNHYDHDNVLIFEDFQSLAFRSLAALYQALKKRDPS